MVQAPGASSGYGGSVAEKGEMTPQAESQYSAEGKQRHKSARRRPVSPFVGAKLQAEHGTHLSAMTLQRFMIR